MTDSIARDELMGAAPWTHPRDRETHMTPPPLRVRGHKRPPREVHFDRASDGVWIVLHEWHAIHDKDTRTTGRAAGWYSRASSFWLPAWMAGAAATAWEGLAEEDLIVVMPPKAPPVERQLGLGDVAAEIPR